MKENLLDLKRLPPEVVLIRGTLQGATQTYKDGFHKNTIGDFNPKDTLQIYPSESMYQEGNVFSGINKIKQALGMSTGIESDIIEAVDGVANKKVESSESGGSAKISNIFLLQTINLMVATIILKNKK